MARLIIVCGLPGSGKTTTASSVVRRAAAVRLCPDDWMRSAGIDLWDESARATIEAGQWTLAQQLLVDGSDVVVEWGTWSRGERDVLREWCRANGVQVSLVHLDVPAAELQRRLEVRNATAGEIVIPPHLIDEWIAGPWQPPTADERELFDPFEVPMPTLVSRPWHATDIPFLWDVLHLSIHVRDGMAPPPRSILDEPSIAHYLRDFGRHPGDDAQVVEDERGERIAAAFCRCTPADDPGYGHVAADIPELGMAVIDTERGRGVGRLAFEGLLTRNPVMSLSVDLDNVTARHLYESLGFEWVADEGTAATMLRRK
jgi:predicted kinase/GNAT superfamily N-acetyltransferase